MAFCRETWIKNEETRKRKEAIEHEIREMKADNRRQTLEYHLWLRGWKATVEHHHVGPWRCFLVKVYSGHGWITDEVNYYCITDLKRCIQRLRWLWWRDAIHYILRDDTLERANRIATWLFGEPRLAVLHHDFER